tara:strand:- start:313 stop:495 length:183 start_codon:yes stop_codon:yes gene_type:complete
MPKRLITIDIVAITAMLTSIKKNPLLKRLMGFPPKNLHIEDALIMEIKKNLSRFAGTDFL